MALTHSMPHMFSVVPVFSANIPSFLFIAVRELPFEIWLSVLSLLTLASYFIELLKFHLRIVEKNVIHC